jgi:hypothetical protein
MFWVSGLAGDSAVTDSPSLAIGDQVITDQVITNEVITN